MASATLHLSSVRYSLLKVSIFVMTLMWHFLVTQKTLANDMDKQHISYWAKLLLLLFRFWLTGQLFWTNSSLRWVPEPELFCSRFLTGQTLFQSPNVKSQSSEVCVITIIVCKGKRLKLIYHQVSASAGCAHWANSNALLYQTSNQWESCRCL